MVLFISQLTDLKSRMFSSQMTSLDTNFMHTFLDSSGFMSLSVQSSSTLPSWPFASGTLQVQLIREVTSACFKAYCTPSDTTLDLFASAPSSSPSYGPSDSSLRTLTRRCKSGTTMILSSASHVALDVSLIAAIDSSSSSTKMLTFKLL